MNQNHQPSRANREDGKEPLYVLLSPDAATSLARLQKLRGQTKKEIIERLLNRAAARVAQ
jgi:guanylate kinase